MTWTKLGDEFSDDCANHGLSDAGYRTHVEAIAWLYRVERMDLCIPRHLVRRFAGSENYLDGIAALVALEWWKDTPAHYQIVHHADVIRSSIVAQQKKRDRDKRAQRNHRKTSPVGDDVSADVSDYPDRQTDKQLGQAPTESTFKPIGATDDDLDDIFLPKRSA